MTVAPQCKGRQGRPPSVLRTCVRKTGSRILAARMLSGSVFAVGVGRGGLTGGRFDLDVDPDIAGALEVQCQRE